MNAPPSPGLGRATQFSRAHLLGRIAAAVLGGYAFCWGFIALSMAALYAAKMPFHDAEHLAAILGFLLFVAVFCWAFVTRSLARAWLLLAGGGVLMATAAQLVQQLLIAAAEGH
ncbi:hypothetical protein HNP55_002560 [Paucibacter oligotrophus]|uniref:Iron uptake protein n=1 Tax=Roseateles oligotrophus TaxID=1769250 RepID=A0A840L632_9BURK|nr:iron uptake protein [Roseateles oligotrophus]MBB4844024.1 hypothetical protein [Roseateles oligotrophus]